MSRSVYPVGHYTGLRPGEDDAPCHVVRIGRRQYQLTEDAFGTWILAHGLAETGKGAWTEADLLAQAEQLNLSGTKDNLEELTSRGLLAMVAEEPADAVDFAHRHRFDVLFVGLGNSPEKPDGHAVGLPGLGAVAVLDPDCYELWQWGSVAPTLWHSCEVRATVTTRLGQPVEPVDALREVLGDLRFLIVHGCAYLDVAATS